MSVGRGACAAIAAFAISCASATPATPAAPASVAPAMSLWKVDLDAGVSGGALDAQKRVADFLSRVAAIRHLAPRAQVEARELDRAALMASVRDHVAREMPPDVIRNQGELLVSFGLVPPDFDYEEGSFRLLETQLAGFYEPRDKKMYLASDLTGAASDATLAHELVHALQDQYYDLTARLSYQPEANDRESALQALAEGDATSAMMDLLLVPAHRRAVDVPDDVFASEVEGSMTATPEGASVPRVLRASLVAPYVDGVLFVHALRRRGETKGTIGKTTEDPGWAKVDAAWRSPPETTEQLLHLDKYDAREPAEAIAIPPPPGPGFTAVYDDVFGEEGLRIAVEEWVPKKLAGALAEGWAGDRAVLYRGSPLASSSNHRAIDEANGAPFAAAWHLRFDRKGQDAEFESREAFKILADAIRKGQGTKTAFCNERPTVGPFAVARSMRDLVLVAGPFRRNGNRVASDSLCAKSLRWAADILKAGAP